MDDIVRDVNDGWDNDDPMKPTGLQYVPPHSFIWYDANAS
jgi:hypothetical protein